MSHTKKNMVGWLGYMEDYTTQLGVLKSHYKDHGPYTPNGLMDSNIFVVAHMFRHIPQTALVIATDKGLAMPLSSLVASTYQTTC